jgi:hypothetical protein
MASLGGCVQIKDLRRGYLKPSWEWNERDIHELIAGQVQESLTLDYKACDALARTEGKKREISKDVSAFANSAGGTIVYGVLEDKHVPTKIDVGYLPTEINKEWLEHVIHGNIQRRIDGIRINPVRLTGSAAGKVLYVVSIPQSVRAPHMAADNRFYKRFDFESKPMEEYEVRDVSRRNEAPNLQLTFDWHSLNGCQPPTIELVAKISNSAPEPALNAVVRIYIDARVTIVTSAGWAGPIHHTLMKADQPVGVQVISQNWSALLKLPIWEGEAFLLTDVPLQFELPLSPGEYLFGWRLSSPRMNPKQAFYTVVSNGRTIAVTEHQSPVETHPVA